MKNTGLVIINIMALIFGLIFLRDFYRPNCAGASCIKIPTLANGNFTGGWQYSAIGGSSSGAVQPTGYPAPDHQIEIPLLKGMDLRDVSLDTSGGYCWAVTNGTQTTLGAFAYHSGDEARCNAGWIGWNQ